MWHGLANFHKPMGGLVEIWQTCGSGMLFGFLGISEFVLILDLKRLGPKYLL